MNAQLLCDLCDFCEPFNLTKYFIHLTRHVKSKETVTCPFKQCSFKSNVYNTFKAHKSRYHQASGLDDVKLSLIRFGREDNTAVDYDVGADFGNDNDIDDGESTEDDDELLKCRFGSLFLRMQTVWHCSKLGVQGTVDGLHDIDVLSQSGNRRKVKKILERHNCNPDSIPILVSEIVQITNPLSHLSKEGQLNTTHKRSTFYKEKFTVIEPIEYVLDADRKRKFTHVPILHVLTELLKRGEVLDKVLEKPNLQNGHYRSFYDSLNRKENPLLSEEEFHIALGLYIDDFEICNPLGTSKKKHKLCGIYWVIANLPLQYRSSLSSIYLATLCYSSDIKMFGYDQVLEPLLKDIDVLEHQGVFVQRLGKSVTGTVLYVSSDNLGAHSFAGFQESFSAGKCCRFCSASKEDIQVYAVKSGRFALRTQESLDNCVAELQHNESLTCVDGVKRDCVLNKLSYFETAKGFPPDLLHDLFEGIVPLELGICLKTLILSHFFTLEELNNAIHKFPYRFSDKLNRPQRIPQTFRVSGSIGGNGHENWTLLRLLPLMIGHLVPEDCKVWGILMDLKDIVELLCSSTFSEESLCYLESKISDHRNILLEVFPTFKLKPKHHYLEHYPHHIRRFGPLVDFWTIRFEAKHSFFKRVVQDAKNFKNVPLTLSTQHQLLLTYNLEMPTIIRPDLEVANITNVSPDILDISVKAVIERRYNKPASVGLTSVATLHGTTYSEGMIVSFGQTHGRPNFGKIVKAIIVSQKASLIVEPLTAWYVEHLRCFELCKNPVPDLTIVDPPDLNDYAPLSLYTIHGRHYVSPKAFLLH